MVTGTAYTSRAHVLIDGQVHQAATRDAVAALVEETIEGLYRCEITLTNFGQTQDRRTDYLYLGRDPLDFGKEIGLGLGPGDPPATVFTGRITALEAEYLEGSGARLRVLAEDRLQDLRMTRRTRSFEDLSDSDVIAQIAREHGLTPEVDLPGPSHATLAQVNQSDLAFIRERARACGAEIWVEGSTLHAAPRTARSAEPVELVYGGSLRAFSVRADLAHQCTELAVGGWDVAAKEAIRETSGPGDVSAELEGQVGGSAILQEKFGERVETLVHPTPVTPQGATTLAQAHYRERARRFVTGSGLADGTPQIRVGTTVTLGRLGALFNGTYTVVRVRHIYTLETGYRTEFDVERPWIGQV